MHFPLAASVLRQASPLLLCWAASFACLYFCALCAPPQDLPAPLTNKSVPSFGCGHVLELYGVSGLANANLSQAVPFIKVFSLSASHPSPRLTTCSHRRSGKNTVRPGSRFHNYRASIHQTAFPLSGKGITTVFPVSGSDARNLSIPDSLSISFALVSSNKWT